MTLRLLTAQRLRREVAASYVFIECIEQSKLAHKHKHSTTYGALATALKYFSSAASKLAQSSSSYGASPWKENQRARMMYSNLGHERGSLPRYCRLNKKEFHTACGRVRGERDRGQVGEV